MLQEQAAPKTGRTTQVFGLRKYADSVFIKCFQSGESRCRQCLYDGRNWGTFVFRA